MFTTLTTATAFLEQRRRIDVVKAQAFLMHTMSIVQAARAVAELAPGRYAEILQDGLQVRELAGDGIHPLQSAALELVGELFPLAWNTEENLLEAGEIYLDIESQGFPYGWDQWGECLDDPDQFSDHEELFVFVQCLAGNTDIDYMEAVAERYHWEFTLPDPSGSIEAEKMFERLRRAGLEEFVTVFEIGWFETGNIFFDYNPYDEDGFLYADFTIANIRKLQAQFADSLRISELYDLALAKVKADPGVLANVVKIHERCKHKRKLQAPPSRLLIDIFNAENEVEEDERLIDPFYGPLDGRDTNGDQRLQCRVL